MDIFIRRSEENVQNLSRALEEFGFSLDSEARQQLIHLQRGMIVLGRKPVQIDILNFLDGVDFEIASVRAVEGTLGSVQTRFLGLPDYIATKKASGRPKDLADLVILREYLGSDLSGDGLVSS